MLAIEAEGIIKHYGKTRALGGVDIRIEEGRAFGFLGPNGAGKTTFVKILLDFLRADTGTAKIFGIEADNVRAREKIGFLPENMTAHSFLSVEEFMMFHGKLTGLSKDAARRECDRALKITAMEKYRDRKMSALSKGMRQRAGIAQAVMGNPGLLILDEPTSGLDPIGIKEVRDMLLELREEGTTVFINSHHLSEIEKTCDSVAILNKGEIIHRADRKEILEKSEYLEAKVQGINNMLLKALEEISVKPPVRDEDNLKIFLRSEDQSFEAHKRIVEQGGKLLSMAWKGESLEDIFYRLVKEEEGNDE